MRLQLDKGPPRAITAAKQGGVRRGWCLHAVLGLLLLVPAAAGPRGRGVQSALAASVALGVVCAGSRGLRSQAPEVRPTAPLGSARTVLSLFAKLQEPPSRDMQGKRERPEDDEAPGGDQSRRKPDGQDSEADPDTDESAASEEEDDSEEEDSEEEDEFTLDEFGRVPGGILPHSACYPDLNYGYRCFPSFLDPAASDLASLIADCRATFTARTTRKGQKYSAGETYWLAASAEPRCALEKLARDVFDLHTVGKEAGVDYDPGASGAEWWTLVLDSDDDVGLHWDRDYQMEASADILVHPHLSTVTYLTNVGGTCL